MSAKQNRQRRLERQRQGAPHVHWRKARGAGPQLGSLGERTRRGRRLPCHSHVCDESESQAGHRADHRLGLAVVARGLPGRADPAADGGIGDDPPFPHGLHQLVLGHHALAMLDQVGKQVEHLGLHLPWQPRAMELMAR